jgi:membrane protein
VDDKLVRFVSRPDHSLTHLPALKSLWDIDIALRYRTDLERQHVVSRKKIVWYTKETYSRWSDHHAARLGASVAFYSILSSAPLLLLVTALVALIFGHENAQQTLIYHARQLVGTHGAETANTLLKNAQKPSSGIFSTVVAFITLLFGASGVFMELQDALNIMWDAPKQTTSGLKAMLKERLFSFGMVLSVGFLLLISLIMSTVFAYLGRGFGALVPLSPPVLQGINSLVSFGVIAFLFALMFKYVPNVKIAFRDVVIGAIGTALLFAIGKILLGIYLGKASVGST